MNRVDQVYALLRSYADWEPSIQTWTGAVVRSSGAQGETAGIREPCPHCDGTGKAPGRVIACRFCKGAGIQWTDPQTGRVVNAPSTGQPFTARDYELGVRRRRVRCDRCGGDGCDRCAQTGKTDVLDGRPTDRSLARLRRDWEALRDPDDGPAQELEDIIDRAWRQRREQWARGSYPDLERLLTRLRAEHPIRWRLLDRHLIHPYERLIMTARVRITIDEIVFDLAEGMPDPIVVPEQAEAKTEQTRQLWRHRSAAAEHLRHRRDQQLLAMVDEGFPVSHVSTVFGLTDRRCRQIVASHRPVATAVA